MEVTEGDLELRSKCTEFVSGVDGVVGEPSLLAAAIFTFLSLELSKHVNTNKFC